MALPNKCPVCPDDCADCDPDAPHVEISIKKPGRERGAINLSTFGRAGAGLFDMVACNCCGTVYLIEVHASLHPIVPPEMVPVAPPPSPVDVMMAPAKPPDGLEEMTVSDLLALTRAEVIDRKGVYRKEDLIKRIREHRAGHGGS